MVFWLWTAAGAGVCILLVLTIKLYLIRKAAWEIETAFQNRLKSETNALIDISSRDRRMRSLAASINAQLRTLRSQRLRWERGDLERTPLRAFPMVCAPLSPPFAATWISWSRKPWRSQQPGTWRRSKTGPKHSKS